MNYSSILDKNSISFGGKSLNRAIFAAGLLFISLDYRAQVGEEPFLNLLAVIVFGLLFVYLFSCARSLELEKESLYPIIAFVLVGVISGILSEDVNLYAVLSSALPVFLLIITASVVSKIGRNLENLNALINLVLLFSFFSVVYKLIFGFYYYGLDFDNVRYQVLAGSVPLLFAYGVASHFGIKRPYGNLSLILSVSAVFISVTRTYLGVLLVVLIAAIMMLPHRYVLSYLYRNFIWVALFSFLIFFTLIGDFGLLDRWTQRLSHHEVFGFDLTAASRLAEAQYQLDRLTSEPISAIFGVGFGSTTGISGEYAHLIEIVFGDVAYQNGNYGHNLYVGMMYISGFLFGGFAIFSMCYISYRGYKIAKDVCRNGDADLVFVLMWGVSASVGFLASGLLSGIFGDRLTSVSYGVSLGFIMLALSNHIVANKTS